MKRNYIYHSTTKGPSGMVTLEWVKDGMMNRFGVSNVFNNPLTPPWVFGNVYPNGYF